jgi:hypothetical protein
VPRFDFTGNSMHTVQRPDYSPVCQSKKVTFQVFGFTQTPETIDPEQNLTYCSATQHNGLDLRAWDHHLPLFQPTRFFQTNMSVNPVRSSVLRVN